MSGDENGARTAFVLGGGGVLGSAEVGMLRALLDAGITPDLVVGTSVGALTWAATAQLLRSFSGNCGWRVAWPRSGESAVPERLVAYLIKRNMPNTA